MTTMDINYTMSSQNVVCSTYPNITDNVPAEGYYTSDHPASYFSDLVYETGCSLAETRNNYPTAEIMLCNRDLWLRFHEHVTEMIITKRGRRMFPSLQFSIKNLDPNKYYNIFVDIVPADCYRWKFQNGKWITCGAIEEAHMKKVYLHPDSPNTGKHWMKEAIVFGKLKLTNNKDCKQDQIMLTSMQKYQPRIHVIEVCQDTASQRQLQSHAFIETQFMAVTAYQNTDVTQLKIDYNPFAKGFRDTQDNFLFTTDYNNLSDSQENLSTSRSHVSTPVEYFHVGEHGSVTPNSPEDSTNPMLDSSRCYYYDSTSKRNFEPHYCNEEVFNKRVKLETNYESLTYSSPEQMVPWCPETKLYQNSLLGVSDFSCFNQQEQYRLNMAQGFEY